MEAVVKLWDVDSRKQPNWEALTRNISDLSLAPDGKKIATDHVGTVRKGYKVWDVATGHEIKTLSWGIHCWKVAFGPDGRTLAATDLELKREGVFGVVQVWDTDTWASKALLKGPKGWVQCIAFSPDGHTLACGGDDRAVRLWDIETGRETRCLEGHSQGLEALAFSPDGKLLASAAGRNLAGEVKVWDTVSGRVRLTLSGPHWGKVRSLAFSPDGLTVASAGNEGSVRLWDPQTGRNKLTLTGHRGPVIAVRYSPDGRTVVSRSEDQTLRFWQAATGQERFSYAGHASQVRTIAFSADGRTLATADSEVVLLHAAKEKDVLNYSRRQAEQSPADPGARIDLVRSCWGYFLECSRQGDSAEARRCLEEGMRILGSLREANQLSLDQQSWQPEFEQALKNGPPPSR